MIDNYPDTGGLNDKSLQLNHPSAREPGAAARGLVRLSLREPTIQTVAATQVHTTRYRVTWRQALAGNGRFNREKSS
jgi:hypothetical protein